MYIFVLFCVCFYVSVNFLGIINGPKDSSSPICRWSEITPLVSSFEVLFFKILSTVFVETSKISIKTIKCTAQPILTKFILVFFFRIYKIIIVESWDCLSIVYLSKKIYKVPNIDSFFFLKKTPNYIFLLKRLFLIHCPHRRYWFITHVFQQIEFHSKSNLEICFVYYLS